MCAPPPDHLLHLIRRQVIVYRPMTMKGRAGVRGIPLRALQRTAFRIGTAPNNRRRPVGYPVRAQISLCIPPNGGVRNCQHNHTRFPETRTAFQFCGPRLSGCDAT